MTDHVSPPAPLPQAAGLSSQTPGMESGAGDDMTTDLQTTTHNPPCDLFSTAMSSWDSALAFAKMMTRAPLLPVSLVVRTMRPGDKPNKPSGPINEEATAANILLIGAHAQELRMPFLYAAQNMHNIHGTVMLSGKLAIGLIKDRSGFVDINWTQDGNDVAMFGFVKDRTGEYVRVEGPRINIKTMQDRFGRKKDYQTNAYSADPTSAWHTQPDIQARYAAARAFANLHCPQVLAGMSIDDGTYEGPEVEPAQPVRIEQAVRTALPAPTPAPTIAKVAPVAAPPIEVEQHTVTVQAADVAPTAARGWPTPVEMYSALPDSIDGVDQQLYTEAGHYAMDAVHGVSTHGLQILRSLYVWVKSPEKWGKIQQVDPTPAALEQSLRDIIDAVKDSTGGDQ